MSHRCTNAFEYASRIYPGGCQVADDDPILKTHAANFVRVETVPAFTETATVVPGEQRAVSPSLPASEPETASEAHDAPRKRGRPRKAADSAEPTPQEETDA